MSAESGIVTDASVSCDFGHRIHERDLEKGLRELNPQIEFDPGGRKGIVHPMQNIRQGVWFRGRNIIAIERGMIPEFERIDFKTGMVLVIGWRLLFEVLLRRKIPGLTRENLCAKFGVPVKYAQDDIKVVCKTQEDYGDG